MQKPCLTWICAIGLVLLGLVPAARAQFDYDEDFTTTAARDSALTTADWNTIDNAAQLFEFEPTLLGTSAGFNVEDVVVRNGIGYLALLGGGLGIYDMDDPSAPVLVQQFAPGGLEPISLSLQGNLLATASRIAGFQILDVQNPTAPVVLGGAAPGGSHLAVELDGNRLYCGTSVGLYVYDVSDPTNPVQLSLLPTAQIRAVAVNGNRVALAIEGDATVGLVDVTDPSAPVLVDTIAPGGSPFGIDFTADEIFVANQTAQVVVIDASDPANLVVESTVPTGFATRDVERAGDRLYVAQDDGFVAVLGDDGTQWTVRATVIGGDNHVRIDVDGDLVHVASRTFGFSSFRVSLPTGPSPVSTIPTIGLPTYEVVVRDGFAYVGQGTTFRVIDVRNVQSPVQVGSLALDGPSKIVLRGDLAYVSDFGQQFHVVDISDPANPGLVTTVGPAFGEGAYVTIAVAEPLAVVSTENVGMKIYDVSNPAAPTEITTVPGTPVYNTMQFSGDFLFAAAENTDLQIWDLSDPAFPVAVGMIPTGGVGDFEIRGNALVVVEAPSPNQTYAVREYDISDPLNPVGAGLLLAGQIAGGVDIELAGDRVWIATPDGRLGSAKIFPLTGGTIVTGPLAGAVGSLGDLGRGLAIEGQYAFAAIGSGVQIVRIYQDELDTTRDRAVSVELDDTNDTIIRMRVSSTQTDGVTLQYTTDPVNWGYDDVTVFDEWFVPVFAGNDLRWRSQHAFDTAGSRLTSVQIAYRTAAARIQAVEDVPNDQGRAIRVRFTRSGHDFAEELTTPVTGYQIYQRVDGSALQAAALQRTDRALDRDIAEALRAIDPSAVTVHGDRAFVDGTALSTFPAGTWEAVGYVAATQSDLYQARVSTVADSSDAGIPWSTFLVTTHTTIPTQWFTSEPDSGYSTDDLAPAAPQNLLASYAADGVTLDWSDSPENDLRTYRVYRGSAPGFAIDPSNLVAETTGSQFVDETTTPWDGAYQVTAVDHAGNESEPGAPGTVTAVEGPASPTRARLESAQPNPFNPRTQLRFSLPREGHARMAVYDVSGRRVTTLVDGTVEAGSHAVVWDGTDADGRAVASGVYLYRLDTDDGAQSRRMVLVR